MVKQISEIVDLRLRLTSDGNYVTRHAITLFFFYKNAYNLAEPEDVLILTHTFS